MADPLPEPKGRRNAGHRAERVGSPIEPVRAAAANALDKFDHAGKRDDSRYDPNFPRGEGRNHRTSKPVSIR